MVIPRSRSPQYPAVHNWSNSFHPWSSDLRYVSHETWTKLKTSINWFDDYESMFVQIKSLCLSNYFLQVVATLPGVNEFYMKYVDFLDCLLWMSFKWEEKKQFIASLLSLAERMIMFTTHTPCLTDFHVWFASFRRITCFYPVPRAWLTTKQSDRQIQIPFNSLIFVSSNGFSPSWQIDFGTQSHNAPID